MCFVAQTPLTVFKLETLYFIGYLYIYQRCAYCQIFYFLNFFTGSLYDVYMYLADIVSQMFK